MSFSEVVREYDEHIAAASDLLYQSAKEMPDIISPARFDELDDALNRLYLPNIDFYGNAYVTLANKVDDPVAYLPGKAGEFVQMLQVGVNGRHINSYAHPNEQDSDGIAMETIGLLPKVIQHDKKYSMPIFAITEITGWNKNNQPLSVIGGLVLHELTHFNQSFRPPTFKNSPDQLAYRPILRYVNDRNRAREEAETYWQQYNMLEPAEKLYDKQQIERITENLDENLNIPNDVSGFATMIALLKSGYIHTDRDPSPKVVELLKKKRVII